RRSAMDLRRGRSASGGPRRRARPRARPPDPERVPVRLLRPGDARAGPFGDSRRGLSNSPHPASRPLRVHASRRGDRHARARGVIRPVLAGARAPAAKAAVCAAAGIFAGSWSVEGGVCAALLVLVSAAALAVLSGRRSDGFPFRLAFVTFWLAAGFFSGRER